MAPVTRIGLSPWMEAESFRAQGRQTRRGSTDGARDRWRDHRRREHRRRLRRRPDELRGPGGLARHEPRVRERGRALRRIAVRVSSSDADRHRPRCVAPADAEVVEAPAPLVVDPPSAADAQTVPARRRPRPPPRPRRTRRGPRRQPTSKPVIAAAEASGSWDELRAWAQRTWLDRRADRCPRVATRARTGREVASSRRATPNSPSAPVPRQRDTQRRQVQAEAEYDRQTAPDTEYLGRQRTSRACGLERRERQRRRSRREEGSIARFPRPTRLITVGFPSPAFPSPRCPPAPGASSCGSRAGEPSRRAPHSQR